MSSAPTRSETEPLLGAAAAGKRPAREAATASAAATAAAGGGPPSRPGEVVASPSSSSSYHSTAIAAVATSPAEVVLISAASSGSPPGGGLVAADAAAPPATRGWLSSFWNQIRLQLSRTTPPSSTPQAPSASSNVSSLSAASSRFIPKKGRCWCCWEESETPANPLVRVCLGCKDPDLQWIHQVCIDEYISALPPPRQPPPPQPLLVAQQQLALPPPPPRLLNAPASSPLDPTGTSSTRITSVSHVAIDVGIVAAASSSSSSSSTSSSSTSSHSRRSSHRQDIVDETAPLLANDPTVAMGAHPPPRASSNRPRFYCTRCADPYTVIETPIPRIYVLMEDLFLKLAMLVMTVCIIVLTVCCIILLVQHWGTNHYVIDIGYGFRVRTTVFAGAMLLFCHALNGMTFWMVWDHCGGRTRKHVVPISDEVLEEHERQSVSAATAATSTEGGVVGTA
ncbi:hypothetical protein DFJ73DRAFT_824146 [Zopfochytrium polystomum]|nr:hypothetical protein DFJ73DRAFT_824146 [Zopfochytrium polystomum]